MNSQIDANLTRPQANRNRAIHGDLIATDMEQEASEVGPTLDERSHVVVTCRRD